MDFWLQCLPPPQDNLLPPTPWNTDLEGPSYRGIGMLTLRKICVKVINVRCYDFYYINGEKLRV